jgi:uncharacterized phage-associated protein
MSAVDSPTIANAFVDVADHLLTQMKLHKLTYIAHGWNLAIFGEPLVADAPEAWDNGPVFPLIWSRALEFGCDEQGRILNFGDRPAKLPLSRSQEDLLRRVWKRYSRFSAGALSNMTHAPGTPWTETYKNRGSHTIIDNEMIKTHYGDLAGRIGVDRGRVFLF